MTCALCFSPISAARAICDSCLHRGHAWPGCPSPGRECTCGFSEAFWADVNERYLAMPLVIVLYAGLHGWEEGFVAEGWRCVSFDIVDMCARLGHRRPANVRLVLQDVLTLYGSQFRDADLIVGSPPCQGYSYRAMPWSRARSLPPPDNSLFDACFRIRREASESAGRYIPLIVENVRGAQKWVGKAAWHFGSYYLWGDVPALMPIARSRKIAGENWKNFRRTGEISPHWRLRAFDFSSQDGGYKTAQQINIRGGAGHTRHMTNPAEHIKNRGGSWFDVAHNTSSGCGHNPVNRPEHLRIEDAGIKLQSPGHHAKPGSGPDWYDGGAAAFSSNSLKRAAASAMLAKIPFPLAQHIARVFKPTPDQELSVVSPLTRAVNVSSAQLVTPATATAGSTALNPLSGSEVCRAAKTRARKSGAPIAPGNARAGEKR